MGKDKWRNLRGSVAVSFLISSTLFGGLFMGVMLHAPIMKYFCGVEPDMKWGAVMGFFMLIWFVTVIFDEVQKMKKED
jgi:hypothetical protein